MPSWPLHKKWAVKAGIDPYVAEQIDRLIDRDFGQHDIGRKRVSECWNFLYNVVLPNYSYDGVKAFFLHHALDRLAYKIKDLIERAREARQRYAWVDSTVLIEIEKFMWRLVPIGQPALDKHGRMRFSRFFTTGRAIPKWGDLFGYHPLFNPYLIDCAKQVLEFLCMYFSDIVSDIAEEIKKNKRKRKTKRK